MVVLVLFLCCVGGSVLSRRDLLSVRSAVMSSFALSPSFGRRCSACDEGHVLGSMLRLVFHDAAGGPVGEGSNGCVDLSSRVNAGLHSVVAAYERVHAQTAPLMSRADLWVLGAQLALEMATTPSAEKDGGEEPQWSGTLTLPFKTGRVDRENCTGLDDNMIPQTNVSWIEMIHLFSGRMGMSVRQIVAIMGAHSLGRISREVSGVQGSWNSFSSSFSNLYYKSLINTLWINPNASTVWIENLTPNVMISPDVELLYTPSSQCGRFLFGLFEGRGCVTNASPADVVQAFAANQTAFYGSFSEAWALMTEYGNATLRSVCDKSADFNGDARVDILDLTFVLDSVRDCENCAADLNCDLIVDSNDVLIVKSVWN